MAISLKRELAMDNNPRLMFEYCRDRIQHLKAELELLKDMIGYLERQEAGSMGSAPMVTGEHTPHARR